MRAIAVANQKGGVGKTTSTATLGACLALRGRRVLLIDIDPQANLSIHLNVDIHEDRPSVYGLLIGQADAEDVIQTTSVPNLDIIPADINLAGAEIELVGVVGRETVLKEALAPVIDRYDYLLIDCPPSLGLLTLNAFTTVTELFIPLQTEFFALHGMSKLMETVEIVRKRLNPALRITGIIATLHDLRTNLANEVLENIRDYFGDRVFKTIIRKNVRLAESPSYGQVIMQYDNEAAGAQDYMALTEEVMAQETGDEPLKGVPVPEFIPRPPVEEEPDEDEEEDDEIDEDAEDEEGDEDEEDAEDEEDEEEDTEEAESADVAVDAPAEPASPEPSPVASTVVPPMPGTPFPTSPPAAPQPAQTDEPDADDAPPVSESAGSGEQHAQ